MAAVNNSGFWGPYNDAYTLLDGKMPRLDAMRRIVNRDGYRATKALFDALIGAASGGTASATHARIGHRSSNGIGSAGSDLGLNQIVTVTDINRATTAADITALKNIVDTVTVRPVPYPRDLSGNGGPALA